MGTGTAAPPTDFENILSELEGLTPSEIVERVTSEVSDRTAQRYALRKRGLSLETLRFVSAATLTRQRRIHAVGTH
jgi:hypothetical protein